MKYLTIIAIALFTWIPARAETHLERAYASLTVAVNDTKKETVTLKNAYNAAVKKAADAAKQGESLKAAATKAADIQDKSIAALEGVKLALEASK